MENKQEVANALDDFIKQPIENEVSSILEQYLLQIASSGITILSWNQIKPLIQKKMNNVIDDFEKKHPMDQISNCPNVEKVTFEEMKLRLNDYLGQFKGIPFTIQRLCELITDGNLSKQYKKSDKFMRGLEKNLLVVTTVDPLGNRIMSDFKSSQQNGLSLSSDPLLEMKDIESSIFLQPSLPPPSNTSLLSQNSLNNNIQTINSIGISSNISGENLLCSSVNNIPNTTNYEAISNYQGINNIISTNSFINTSIDSINLGSLSSCCDSLTTNSSSSLGNSSPSWFSGLTSVVESPNFYPNWKPTNVSNREISKQLSSNSKMNSPILSGTETGKNYSETLEFREKSDLLKFRLGGNQKDLEGNNSKNTFNNISLVKDEGESIKIVPDSKINNDVNDDDGISSAPPCKIFKKSFDTSIDVIQNEIESTTLKEKSNQIDSCIEKGTPLLTQLLNSNLPGFTNDINRDNSDYLKTSKIKEDNFKIHTNEFSYKDQKLEETIDNDNHCDNLIINRDLCVKNQIDNTEKIVEFEILNENITNFSNDLNNCISSKSQVESLEKIIEIYKESSSGSNLGTFCENSMHSIPKQIDDSIDNMEISFPNESESENIIQNNISDDLKRIISNEENNPIAKDPEMDMFVGIITNEYKSINIIKPIDARGEGDTISKVILESELIEDLFSNKSSRNQETRIDLQLSQNDLKDTIDVKKNILIEDFNNFELNKTSVDILQENGDNKRNEFINNNGKENNQSSKSDSELENSFEMDTS